MTDLYVAPKQNGKKKIDLKPRGLSVERRMNVFASYFQNPTNISFQDQKKDESIILFLRPHYLTNFPWIFLSILLFFLPPVIAIILPMIKIEFLSSPIVTHFAAVYILLYYLIVFSYAFISFLTWFYNIFIVTPNRIVDINYSDIVIHDVSETKLNQIEDVRYDQAGFIPTLFNYGNLYAQTAAEKENFEANSIPKPKEATDIIADLIGGNE
jgi:hypothetical protein